MDTNNQQPNLSTQNNGQQGFDGNPMSHQQAIIGGGITNSYQIGNAPHQQLYQQQVPQPTMSFQQLPQQYQQYRYGSPQLYQSPQISHYYPQQQQHHFLTGQNYSQNSLPQTSQQMNEYGQMNLQFPQHILQSSQQYMPERDEGETIFVAETCDIITSSPSPDFSNEASTQAGGSNMHKHQLEQPTMRQHGDQTPQQQNVMPMGATNIVERGKAAYYLQIAQPHHHYLVTPSSENTSRMAFQYQQPPQGQQYQHFLQNPQAQSTSQNVALSIRRNMPFEEEEDEEEFGNTEIPQKQQQTYTKHENFSEVDEPRHTAAKVDKKSPLQVEPKLLPRLRSGRRKQIFENDESKTTKKLDTADNINKSIEKQSNSSERKVAPKKSSPKKEKNEEEEKPLIDKIHYQAVQRIATAEGWRRMNGWLKNAIDTMNLPKLRKLLSQLFDADISVKLLQMTSEQVTTPKMVKDLQKCADKEIANIATKMVNKWKQAVVNANKVEALPITKVSKQQITTSSAAIAKNKISRRSTDSSIDMTVDVPTTSSTTMKTVASDSILAKGRIASTNSGNLNENSGSKAGNAIAATPTTGTTTQERPKVAAKAKAKISRPRLTGLEGDDEQPPQTAKSPTAPVKRSGGDTDGKTTIGESPLGKIMAATARFQAQQQKRKPVEVVFSDNFMDSLSAADTVQPKKQKIVRKKLNPPTNDDPATTIAANITASCKKTEEIEIFQNTVQSSTASIDTASPKTATVSSIATIIKRRVRFSDEFGRDLVDVRFFEIEEGERINVTKTGGMSKEEIKHFDSQREKQALLDARRHGFSGFSSVTDPFLMPPGYRIASTGGIPPQFAGPKTDSRFPWKLHAIEFQPVIIMEPGSKSEAKILELERQKTILPALLLPIPLPISDIDEQELKRQREENLMHMPKIIPLELITEMPENQVPIQIKDDLSKNSEFENWKSLTIGLETEKNELQSMQTEPMEMDEDDVNQKKEENVDDELMNNEPIAPFRSSSTDEDSNDVEMLDVEQQPDKRDDLIASPEPETVNAPSDLVGEGVKTIPTEQIGHDKDIKEDLDIRDLQQNIFQKQQTTPNEVSPLPAATIKSSSFSGTTLSPDITALLRKKNLSSLLQSINTFCGGTPTKTGDEGSSNVPTTTALSQPNEQEKSSVQQKHESLGQPIPIIPLESVPSVSQQPPQQQQQFYGATLAIPTNIPLPQINIPPPPIHLYPHRPPLSTTQDAAQPPPPPPRAPPTTLSMAEARDVVGTCPFFMRTNTCKYGEKCKFAHDNDTITLGVQMAMRGVNIAGRGGFRGIGRGGRGGPIATGMGRGRPNNAEGMKSAGMRNQGISRGGGAGFGRRGGNGHFTGDDNDRYNVSPIRNRDRSRDRHRRTRRSNRSRSRSRDRRSRNHRSRSRDRNRSGRSSRRERSMDRRHSHSESSSSSSSSSSTYSRSPSSATNSRDNKKEEEQQSRDSEENEKNSSPKSN